MKRKAGLWKPLLYVGPAVVFLLIYQMYPAVQTIILSFKDRRSEQFVGLENYRYVFTRPLCFGLSTITAVVIFFTVGTVGWDLFLHSC